MHAATAVSGTWTAAYDAAGDMTCRAPTGANSCAGNSPNGSPLTWDTEGRLVEWASPTGAPWASSIDLYDGEGNRVQQQTVSGGVTTQTYYIGNLEEVSVSGGTTTTTTYYYAGNGGPRIATATNGVISYLASDTLGTAEVALDANGNTTAAVLYAPYGTTRYSSGTMPGSYGYTGQHADAVTGLDYYGARYYDAVAGVFASADTVLPGKGYDVWGLSRYAYVEGNPINRDDPSGHCWPICAITAGLGAAAGIAVGVAAAYQAFHSGQPVTFATVAGAVVHVAADAALGGSAGFLMGSGNGGAIVGGLTAAAGVMMSGKVDFHNPASLQSAFEQITISADVGALGGALASGIEKGTFLAGAGNAVVKNMITQGVVNAGAEFGSEMLGQERDITAGRGARVNGYAIGLSFGAGVIGGYMQGAMWRFWPRATSRELVDNPALQDEMDQRDWIVGGVSGGAAGISQAWWERPFGGEQFYHRIGRARGMVS